MPKEQLYRQFNWKPTQRECLDGDISRLNFVNWISPRTLPALTVGEDIKEIIVVEILHKRREFGVKNIELLTKSIPQRIVYALSYDNEVKLAVFHTKLFITGWQPYDTDFNLLSSNYSLDNIWENIAAKIGNFEIEQQHTLSEQIENNEERNKIERKIKLLESKISFTRQSRRKRELYQELQKIKQTLNYAELQKTK